ncbi:MAG: hypothetical protein Q9227_004171 [Pyrenula ochraceoflavens]
MSKVSSKSLGTVLVVGGCGFLGSHIVEQLLNFPNEFPDDGPLNTFRGESDTIPQSSTISFPSLQGRYPSYTQTNVHVLDLRCTYNRREGASYHEGDITSTTALLDIFKKVRPDVVINTVSPDPLESSKALLYKADAEVLVLEENRKHGGLLTCAVRPAGIMGERDSIVALQQMRHAHYSSRWKLRMQLGGGENLFDYTYAGNIAHGILLAAERLTETYIREAEGKAAPLDFERVDGEAFIVTNDQPMYFWDVARNFMALLGRPIEPSEIIVIPVGLGFFFGAGSELAGWLSGRKPGLTRTRVKYSSITRYYSCDKAKMRLGYQPIVGLEETFARCVKWYLETIEKQSSTEEKKNQ